MRARTNLYKIARFMGDVEAVEHGGAVGGAKRYARRRVYRKTNSYTTRLLRSVGLISKRRR